MDTTLAPPPVGQLLDGRYRVVSPLAHGGMATVYLGTDTRLDRTVALKIMRAELASDEDFVRRFAAEARSVARLSHPNVVTVYDQGSDGRTLYLAMEYVPGRTLRDLLRQRGRLTPREALDIMDGVLAGLAAAHQAGIVHRDVKPENVLLGDAQIVKVADFGLARLLSGAAHTKSGMIIGTAAYLAPEQVSGGLADARTDVYAAGVMLFELLTGTQPHIGDTPLAVAYKHVNEAVPPPSSVVPGLPPALDALLALATSRDPGLRPADAGQFLHAISGIRAGLPASAAPLPAPPGAASLPQQGRAGQAPAAETLPPIAANGAWDGAARNGSPWDRPRTAGPAWDGAGAAGSSSGGVAPAPRTAWDDAGATPLPAWDLIPGMAPPPARQSFGAPRNGSTGPLPDLPPAPQDGPDQPGVHRTLIVSSGMDEPYPEAAHRWRPALREPRLQRLLYSRRLVYLVLALAVVLVIGLLGWWVLEGRYTSVPAVGGMTAAAARADLSDAGLTVAAGESQVDNQVTKGRVIRTIPAAGGRIARGGRVTLVVSAGPRMIAVPEVTGQPLAAADTLLRHAGLFPGAVRHQTSATIAAGVVLATRPAGGTSWPQPDPVTLVVSAGPPLPNFVGLPKTTAEGWASQNSVQLNEVAAHRSEAPAGTVIRQSLPPGHAFTPHQVITIVYSLGPPPVNIPNVDGMRVGTAVQVLTRLGFHVTVSGLKLFQTVVSYSPQGSAPKGSTITLQVGFQF